MLDTLNIVSHQWASRPADERFLSLPSMLDMLEADRARSAARVMPNRQIQCVPEEDHKGLVVVGPNGGAVVPTNWSFGQLASLAGAPAGYLRTLPSDMAADCINYGLQVQRSVDEVGVYLTKTEAGHKELRAATGPNYGRVYNADIIAALIERFGDGATAGGFKVPGEFGKDVPITTANTTLYASDRDMFVFLADECNRIEIPNRRNGQSGSLARGFYVANSEVGASTLIIGLVLFDYACMNRILWGVAQHVEHRYRHTSGAPLRWIEEAQPLLYTYANASAGPIEAKILAAQAAKIDKVEEFLAKRFTAPQARAFQAAHLAEEGRPIETIWDAVTGATAFARGIEHMDKRTQVERDAGKLLDLVAA
jgi:hypothetical protein